MAYTFLESNIEDNENLLKKKYENLSYSKVLKKDGESRYVYLLENGVIKKKYNNRNKKDLAKFENEIKTLNKLRDCPFVPKILALDIEQLIIYMDNCGYSLDLLDPSIYKNKLHEINTKMRMLEEKWGLVKYKKITNHGINNPYTDSNNLCKNICLKDNRIFIVGFGSTSWKEKNNKN